MNRPELVAALAAALRARRWRLATAESCTGGMIAAACTVTARHMGVADPGAIVWDEIVAFWIVLWLVTPTDLWTQLAAFVLFRTFDAAKPGPVGWADRLFKLQPGQAIGWRQGCGIVFDDLVAAGCTLLVLALWITWWR